MRYKRDGTLTFMPDPDIRKKTQLFVVAAAGGTPRQLTESPFDVGTPVWTADSQTLLYTGDELQGDERNRQPTNDLYAIPVKGGDPRRLTQNPGSETGPAVSPMGDRLAFVHMAARRRGRRYASVLDAGRGAPGDDRCSAGQRILHVA
jgi:Tol biopolymer transport system component